MVKAHQILHKGQAKQKTDCATCTPSLATKLTLVIKVAVLHVVPKSPDCSSQLQLICTSPALLDWSPPPQTPLSGLCLPVVLHILPPSPCFRPASPEGPIAQGISSVSLFPARLIYTGPEQAFSASPGPQFFVQPGSHRKGGACL